MEITVDDIERIIIAVHVLLQVVDESIVRAHSWTASSGLLVQLDLQFGLIKSIENSRAASSFVGGRLVLVLLFLIIILGRPAHFNESPIIY